MALSFSYDLTEILPWLEMTTRPQTVWINDLNSGPEVQGYVISATEGRRAETWQTDSDSEYWDRISFPKCWHAYTRINGVTTHHNLTLCKGLFM
jgi:hypothetical protein